MEKLRVCVIYFALHEIRFSFGDFEEGIERLEIPDRSGRAEICCC